MARKARQLSSKGLYIVQLTGDKLFIGENDKNIFIETIEKFFADGGKIYGYSLTDKCIQMVVKESVKGISMAMKSVTVSYARYFNKTHESSGALFADRFKSIPLESPEELDDAVKALQNNTLTLSSRTKKSDEKKASNKSTVKKSLPKSKPISKKEVIDKPVESATPKETAPIVEKKSEKKKKNSLPSWLL